MYFGVTSILPRHHPVTSCLACGVRVSACLLFNSSVLPNRGALCASTAPPLTYRCRVLRILLALRPLNVCYCLSFDCSSAQFKGGIIVSVDSRSTMGPYIGERPIGLVTKFQFCWSCVMLFARFIHSGVSCG